MIQGAAAAAAAAGVAILPYDQGQRRGSIQQRRQ